MASEEFSQAVRGSGDKPIATTEADAFTTNNFTNGGSIAIDGDDYPYEIDPDFLVEELIITETGDGIVVDIETIDGNEIEDIHLRGVSIALNTLEIDNLTIRDPDETEQETYGLYVGE